MSLIISAYGSGSLSVKNAWSHWVDHIMKKNSKLELTGATMLRHNGEVAASSKGFAISMQDFNNIVACFADTSSETVRIRGITYCIKSRDSEQFIVFNGQTYFIVSKTNYLYIIVMCRSRKTSGKAALWIKGIAESIRDRKC